MIPLYDAQLLTYLKLTGLRLGLLINFNVPLIKEGIKRLGKVFQEKVKTLNLKKEKTQQKIG